MAGKKPVFNTQILNHPPVEQTGVEERATRFTKRSIKGPSKMQGLHMVLSMIDLTTLEGKDTPGKVNQLCTKARHLHDHIPGLPTLAAICVYPSMVSVAKKSITRKLDQGCLCGNCFSEWAILTSNQVG